MKINAAYATKLIASVNVCSDGMAELGEDRDEFDDGTCRGVSCAP